MDGLVDVSLNRAFQLAYFVHGDKTLALHIASEALAKLEIAVAAQDKRLYYTPVGRSTLSPPKPQTFRTKVSMTELHLLQRLVYTESELCERQQEQVHGGRTRLAEEDMIIRFIKYLVKIAVRRNAFYVTLSIGRLLYNYSTAETMDLYNLVVQDPDRGRDDYYYRSRKKRLMEELLERFGNFMKVIHGPRGEERFQVQDNSSPWARLVRQCLNLFTPWNTPCLIPDRFDPKRSDLPRLAFKDTDPDKEHTIEVDRMHAILHPDCYRRLIEALRLAPPEQRLAVPQFFMAKDHNDEIKPPSDRENPPPLNEEERRAVWGQLAGQAARRKAASTGLLLIAVDGRERARLDLNRTSRVRLAIEEAAEQIEVRARDKGGDVLLAIYLLPYEEEREGKACTQSSITLEGGQKISFAVSRTRHPDGEAAGASVEVRYQETHPVRAVALYLRQLKHRIFPARDPIGSEYSAIRKPAWAFVLLAVVVVGVAVYFQWRKGPIDQPKLAEQKQESPPIAKETPTLPATAAAPPSPSATETQNPVVSPSEKPVTGLKPKRRSTFEGVEKVVQRPERAAEVARAPRPAESTPESGKIPAEPRESPGDDAELTRTLRGKAAAKFLPDIQRVYVGSLGDDPFSQAVREQLIRQLQTSERWAVAQTPDEADAALKGSVKLRLTRGNQSRGEAPGGGFVVLQLVNSEGEALWNTKKQHSGSAADVAAQIVKDLLAEAQKR